MEKGKSIYEKLFKLQTKIGAIARDKENPYFKSSYFDVNKLIEEIKPLLNEVGLIIQQPLTHLEFKPALKTIIVDPDTQTKIEDTVILPENSDPQIMGSIITYFRRYALQSLLFLQAEDDDANSASNSRGKPPVSQPQPLKPEVPTKNTPHTIGEIQLTELNNAIKDYCILANKSDLEIRKQLREKYKVKMLKDLTLTQMEKLTKAYLKLIAEKTSQ